MAFLVFFYRLLFKLLGGPVVSQQRLIKKVRATDRPVVRKGFTPLPAKWLRELLELDAKSVFSSIYTPMILFGGEKDLQCKPDDIFKIAEVAQGPSETVMVEGMTHMLRVDKNPATLLGSMRLLSQPVERIIIDKIVQRIHSVSATNY